MPEADIVIESPGGTLLPPRDLRRAGAILSTWRTDAIRLGGRPHGPGVVRWAIVGDTRQVEAELAVERAVLAAGGRCGRSYPHTIRYHRIRREGTVEGFSDLTVGVPPGTPESVTADKLHDSVALFAEMIRLELAEPGGAARLQEALDAARRHNPTSLEARLLEMLVREAPLRQEARKPAAATGPRSSVEWLTQLLVEAWRIKDSAKRRAWLERNAHTGATALPVGQPHVFGGSEVGTAIIAADQLLRNAGEAVDPAELRRVAGEFQRLWRARRTGEVSATRPDRAARDSGGLPADEEPDQAF